jgi:tetratricopeptide (TPR) repeat protein
MIYRSMILTIFVAALAACSPAMREPTPHIEENTGFNAEAAIHLLGAKRAEQHGDHVGAMRHWKRAVHADSADAVLRTGLAQALHRVGQDSLAIVHALVALELDSAYADAHHFLAGYYRKNGSSTDALAHLEALERIGGSETSVWELIHIYRSMDREDDARRVLENMISDPATGQYDLLGWARISTSMKLDRSTDLIYEVLRKRWPDSGRWVIPYAEYLDDRERIDEVEQVLLDGLQRHAESSEIARRLAWFYTGQGRWIDAESAMSRVPIVGPQDLAHRKAWLAMLIDRGQHEQASRHIERLLDQHPADAQLNILLGQAYLAQRRYTESAGAFSVATSSDTTVEAISGLVVAHLRAGHFADAERAGYNAVSRFPGDSRLRFLYAMALRSQLKWSESVVQFEELCAGDSTNVQWLFNLGSGLERAGRYDESVQVFRRLLIIDGQHAPSLNYLGYMFAERDIHLEEALDLITQAVALQPRNASYLDSMGWVLHRLGRESEAQRFLEEAAVLDSNSVETLDHLGDVLLKSGDINAARDTWERAMQLNPGNNAIQGKLDKLPVE